MADVVFVAILVAFFAVGALFVKACDRIIGTDEEAFAGPDEGDEAAEAAQPSAA